MYLHLCAAQRTFRAMKHLEVLRTDEFDKLAFKATTENTGNHSCSVRHAFTWSFLSESEFIHLCGAMP